MTVFKITFTQQYLCQVEFCELNCGAYVYKIMNAACFSLFLARKVWNFCTINHFQFQRYWP